MQVKDRRLDEFLHRLNRDCSFTFSRWGDGEWRSIFGRDRGHNCDGHEYFPAMGTRLSRVLKSRPPYMLGLQPLAQKLFGPRIEHYFAHHNLFDLDWVNADVFHTASQEGRLEPLLENLRARPLLVVGPPHLAYLKKFLGYDQFVTVPPKNAFLALDSVFRDCCVALSQMPKWTTVSISMSMPAKLLIDMLHQKFPYKHRLIDFGALWDPFAGVKSRKYMAEMDVECLDSKTGFDVDRPPNRA